MIKFHPISVYLNNVDLTIEFTNSSLGNKIVTFILTNQLKLLWSVLLPTKELNQALPNCIIGSLKISFWDYCQPFVLVPTFHVPIGMNKYEFKLFQHFSPGYKKIQSSVMRCTMLLGNQKNLFFLFKSTWNGFSKLKKFSWEKKNRAMQSLRRIERELHFVGGRGGQIQNEIAVFFHVS